MKITRNLVTSILHIYNAVYYKFSLYWHRRQNLQIYKVFFFFFFVSPKLWIHDLLFTITHILLPNPTLQSRQIFKVDNREIGSNKKIRLDWGVQWHSFKMIRALARFFNSNAESPSASSPIYNSPTQGCCFSLIRIIKRDRTFSQHFTSTNWLFPSNTGIM